MEKVLQGLEENPETDIHLKSFIATPMKVPNWKTLGYDSVNGFWL